MLTWFQDKFNQLTGSVGGFAARQFINHQYARYGTMTKLEIDPALKSIQGEVLLKGETQPVQFRLSQYRLEFNGASAVFRVKEVSISREWMNLLAAELLKDKPFPIPASAAKWLNLLL